MATIGERLLQPENGWTRYDDTDSLITYVGWTNNTSSSNFYNGTRKYNNSATNSIKFSFFGTGIRIIAGLHSSFTTPTKITIDGIEESYSLQTSLTDSLLINQVLVYEKKGLPNKTHNVTISCPTSQHSSFDAVDVFELDVNLILKNPTTNQHYSLAEKTLIPLPDASPKNMVLHGIEAGKEIQLDEPFNKIQYVSELSTATVGASGKIVTQKLLDKPNKILKISEVRM